MWLLKLALIVLGLACLVFGPMAAYKGSQEMKSGNIRQVKAGTTLLACGIAMVLMGFMLFYFTFTF